MDSFRGFPFGLTLVLVFVFINACTADAGDGSSDAAEIRDPCDSDIDSGVEVGERLPPATVRTCSGDEVALRDVACAHDLTLIDVGSAGFAGCVEATTDYLSDANILALRADGLNVIQVFSTDQNFQPATVEFCTEYVDQYAVDFDFYIDPLAYTDTFGAVHPLSFLIGRDSVIVEKWEGESPVGDEPIIAAHLDEARDN